MMQLPTDLPESLYPLAWTIGSWRGYGTYSAKFAALPMSGIPAAVTTSISEAAASENAHPDAHDEAEIPDAMMLQEMDITVVEQGLQMQVRTYAASAAEPVPVVATAAEGLARLTRGELLWTETSLITIASYRLGTQEEPEPECIADIKREGDVVAGRWEARSLGPRITSRLVAAKDLDADPNMEATRMVGLVSGEFFWAQDRMIPGSDEAATEFSARLARVEDLAAPDDAALAGDDAATDDAAPAADTDAAPAADQ